MDPHQPLPSISEKSHWYDEGGNHIEADTDNPEHEVEFACFPIQDCNQIGILGLELAFEAVDEVGRGQFLDKFRG